MQHRFSYALTTEFDRMARIIALATAVGLSGCAGMKTNLETCSDRKDLGANGWIQTRFSLDDSDKFNADCRSAQRAAKVVLARSVDGTYDPYGLMLGQKFYSMADPKVQEFFKQYLAQENLTVEDLPRLEKELKTPIEIHVAATKPGQISSAEPKNFVCRVQENERRCRYTGKSEASPAPAAN